MAGPLSDPQYERFAQAIFSGMSQVDAYVEAGYKRNTSHAARLVANGSIRARINELKETLFDRYSVTNDRLIREMALMGFANLQDYADLTQTGDLKALERDHAAALTEMTVETYMDGRGDDAQAVKRVKVKVADKLGPLVQLAKMRGMFNADQSGATNVTFTIIKPDSTKRIEDKSQ